MARTMGKIVSPCTGICRIDEKTGWCLGCQRTIEEIADWSGLSPKSRRAIMATLAKRKPDY